MNWPGILDHLAGHRYATADDIRKIFADYHDVLHWLACFLVGETHAPACVIDACNIAERQGPVFHEWLVHWAAHATLRCALQMQRDEIAAVARGYEEFGRVHTKRSLLSPEDLQVLADESDLLATRLDVLCRFVLIMHGIAKESCEDIAGQLRVTPTAVERAYCVAFDTLHLVPANELATTSGRYVP